MNRMAGHVLVLFVLFVFAPRGFCAESELERLRKAFEEKSALISEAHEKAGKSALKKYKQNLSQLQDYYTKKGHLEGVMGVRDAMKQFEEGKPVPKPGKAAPEQPLSRARASYHGLLEKADRARGEQQQRLLMGYAQGLEALMKKLTTEDRLDEAVKVRDAYRKVLATLKTTVATVPVVPAGNASFDKLMAARILHYSFDRTHKEGWISDDTGNDRHGRMRGVQLNRNGRRGMACAFDGSGAHVDLPGMKFANRPFSVAAWVKTSNAKPQTLFEIGGRHKGVILFTRDGLVMFGYRTDDHKYETVTGKSVADSVWHHVAGVVDKSQAIHLYVDGRLAGTKRVKLYGKDPLDGAAMGGSTKSNVDSRTMQIKGTTYSFNGLVDDFTILNRALTAVEVGLLMRR